MFRLPLFSSWPWIGGALAGAALSAAPAYLTGRADGAELQGARQARAELARLTEQGAIEQAGLLDLAAQIEEALAHRQALEAQTVQALAEASQSARLALKRLGETYDPTHACPAGNDDVRVFNAAFTDPAIPAVHRPATAVGTDPQ